MGERRTARVAHVCEACGGPIDVGQDYARVKVAEEWEGSGFAGTRSRFAKVHFYEDECLTPVRKSEK